MLTHLKTCSRCHVEKPTADFPRARSSRDGLFYKCRECANEYSRAWNRANREKVAEWRARNPGVIDATRKRWLNANREQANVYVQRRLMLKRGAYVEDVRRSVLYERDGGRCGICGQHVGIEDASVDHVLPLSKGGEHSYANTQIAHLSCNVRKGNRVLTLPDSLTAGK